MIGHERKSNFDKLEKLQEKAIGYVHNNMNSRADMEELFALYCHISMRINEHLGSVMYRLDIVRPLMNLKSHNKVKFKKHQKRRYVLY